MYNNAARNDIFIHYCAAIKINFNYKLQLNSLRARVALEYSEDPCNDLKVTFELSMLKINTTAVSHDWFCSLKNLLIIILVLYDIKIT